MDRDHLHPVGPDEGEHEDDDGPAESAAATAQRLLIQAEAEVNNSGRLGLADVLAQLAQGWATLALTEPLPEEAHVTEAALADALVELGIYVTQASATEMAAAIMQCLRR